MRFILFFFLLSQINLFAQASAYQKFEWDVVQLGYSNASKLEGVNNGLLLGSEIRYNFRDDFSVGISSDFSFYFDKVEDKDADIFNINSGLLVVDKYTRTDGANRAFFGLGLGEYDSRKLIIRGNEDAEVLEKSSSFGIAARVGYELKRFRFKAQYNFTTKEAMSNYLTLKVGITLWGNYKGR